MQKLPHTMPNQHGRIGWDGVNKSTCSPRNHAPRCQQVDLLTPSHHGVMESQKSQRMLRSMVPLVMVLSSTRWVSLVTS